MVLVQTDNGEVPQDWNKINKLQESEFCLVVEDTSFPMCGGLAWQIDSLAKQIMAAIWRQRWRRHKVKYKQVFQIRIYICMYVYLQNLLNI